MSDPTLLLITGAVFAAVALGVWTVLSGAEERSTIRSSLKALEGYDETDLRQRELEVPLVQRVFQPVGRSLVAVGRSFMPAGYMEGVRKKLIVAGRPAPEDLDRFRAIRVLTVAALPPLVLFVVLLPAPPRTKVIVLLFLGVICLLGPEATLNRRMEERRQAIRVRLPDLIDMLTISVEAGLGFDQALERTVRELPGPLSDEFARMLGEIRAGAGRADALRSLDARTDVPELRSFVLALIQADTFGVSIARILRAQSEEMRIKRRQLAQEEAQKAPVKLLFPMVLCVFPGIFVVLLGPS
ncbi:MAG: type II secretion system F family protein, partial [Actinobacteria bacterium]|nr:type II secretion system F family protein [Actinomycetota bacterium]MBW3651631.1 type II secretion system F family protein [Actinomycetota bacterium]